MLAVLNPYMVHIKCNVRHNGYTCTSRIQSFTSCLFTWNQYRGSNTFLISLCDIPCYCMDLGGKRILLEIGGPDPIQLESRLLFFLYSTILTPPPPPPQLRKKLWKLNMDMRRLLKKNFQNLFFCLRCYMIQAIMKVLICESESGMLRRP